MGSQLGTFSSCSVPQFPHPYAKGMTPRESRLHPYLQPASPKLTLLEEMVMVLTGAGS